MKFSIRFLSFMVLLLTTACASLAQDITPPPGYEYVPPPPTQDIMYYPSVPPNPIAGEATYIEKCQPCHGDKGLGNGPDAAGLPNPVAPIGVAELARTSNPGDWYRVVTEGRIDRFMPPFLSLTERQRWDVLAYVFTLSATAETVAQGEELFQENCSGCHGETGQGDGLDAASFDESMPSFVDQMLMAERSKAELLTGMTHPNLPEIPDVTIGMNEDERWAITDYLRSLTFIVPENEIADVNPLATVGVEEETISDTTNPVAENPQSPGEVVSAGQGIITGEVVNLTSGEVPGDQIVVLHGFDQFQEVISITTQVDSDGIYQFEGLELPENRAYIVTVDYKDMTYTSNLAVVQPGQTEYELPVNIYETTTDTSSLKIDRLHILFEFISADQVRVAELIILSNSSESVVVTENEDVALLTFDLPDGATNLQFQEGALGRDFIETPEGFGDLRAIMPGEGQHQILFSFDIPYERRLEIEQPMELPVQNLIVLSPDIGVEVEGASLVSGGVQDVQGIPYEVFTGEGIDSGGNLVLTLSGRPDLGESSFISTGSTTNVAVGLGVLGGSLLIAGGWLFRRTNRRLDNEDDSDYDDEEQVDNHFEDEKDADSLMDVIIALDDHFKAGGLPEDAYLNRRAVLKEQLRNFLEKENRR